MGFHQEPKLSHPHGASLPATTDSAETPAKAGVAAGLFTEAMTATGNCQTDRMDLTDLNSPLVTVIFIMMMLTVLFLLIRSWRNLKK